MIEDKKQTFDQYLSNSLSKSNYDNLHTILNISKRRCTYIKENPDMGTTDEAVAFADLLGLTTKEFITGCCFGFVGIPTGDFLKLQ